MENLRLVYGLIKGVLGQRLVVQASTNFGNRWMTEQEIQELGIIQGS